MLHLKKILLLVSFTFIITHISAARFVLSMTLQEEIKNYHRVFVREHKDTRPFMPYISWKDANDELKRTGFRDLSSIIQISPDTIDFNIIIPNFTGNACKMPEYLRFAYVGYSIPIGEGLFLIGKLSTSPWVEIFKIDS